MTQTLTATPRARPIRGGSVLVWSTETPPPPRPPLPDLDAVWVRCWCGYEREAGQDCGQPCL